MEYIVCLLNPITINNLEIARILVEDVDSQQGAFDKVKRLHRKWLEQKKMPADTVMEIETIQKV